MHEFARRFDVDEIDAGSSSFRSSFELIAAVDSARGDESRRFHAEHVNPIMPGEPVVVNVTT